MLVKHVENVKKKREKKKEHEARKSHAIKRSAPVHELVSAISMAKSACVSAAHGRETRGNETRAKAEKNLSPTNYN